MTDAAIQVILVDDHQMLRDGLKILIDGEPDIKVIGEANTSEEALKLVKRFSPDVVVMDLGLPGVSGLETIRILKQNAAPCKIVVLTMHGEQEMVTQSFKAGADGFVPKSAAHIHLLDAIRLVLTGERYIHPDAAVNMMEEVTQRFEKAIMLKDLSEREVEVFALSASGYSRADISKQLSISPKTVDTYRLRAMEKLNLNSRVEMIQFAIQAGIMVDDEQ